MRFLRGPHPRAGRLLQRGKTTVVPRQELPFRQRCAAIVFTSEVALEEHLHHLNDRMEYPEVSGVDYTGRAFLAVLTDPDATMTYVSCDHTGRAVQELPDDDDAIRITYPVAILELSGDNR